MKLTEKQKHDPFYQMDRVEFKKLVIRYLGGEITKLSFTNDTFGYDDEFKTLIIPRKSWELEKNDYRIERSWNCNEDYEHILVVALSFTDKFMEMVTDDIKMEVLAITVEDLFKIEGKSVIPALLEKMEKRNTILSRTFNLK